MGYVVALVVHESNLFIGDDHALEHLDLLAHQLGEALRIYRVVAVDKPVFHLRARIIVYDRTAHGELVEVVVRKMIDDLLHCNTYIEIFANLIKFVGLCNIIVSLPLHIGDYKFKWLVRHFK